MTAAEKTLPYSLLGMTAVTGLIDAVSFLSLGHVFTANMTGNVVILGFASAGVRELSIARALTALGAFLAGAVLGGRLLSRATPDTQIQAAIFAFGWEVVFLAAAAFAAVGYHGIESSASRQVYFVIALTALAMGTRNAAVRKLAIPDLTTTVLTLTITGLAADSSLAGGSNPRWGRRVMSVLTMFAGAAAGALVVRHSVSLALAIAFAVSLVSSLALLVAMQFGNRPASVTEN